MPKITPKCKACKGKKVSSTGKKCVPCRGTGVPQKPNLER